MKRNSNSTGFTLVEVLVALVVLSLGLLGLAALQLTSLSFNTNAYSRSQATVFVYDVIDRMRINPAGVTSGAYDVGTPSDAAAKISTYSACKTGSCNCSGAGQSCDVSNLALYDLGTWYSKMAEQGTLPGASIAANYATISRDTTTNIVTVTINWYERDIRKSQVWVVQL